MKLGLILSCLALVAPLASASYSPRGNSCPNVKASFWRYKTTVTKTKTTTHTKTITRGGGGGGNCPPEQTTITLPTTLTLVGEPTTCYPLPASCTNRAPLVNSGFEDPTLAPWTFTSSGSGSGSVVAGTFDDTQYDGQNQFKFAAAPGRLQQTVELCAGAVYHVDVRYRIKVAQEACVGTIGVDGFAEMLTTNDMAGDYDYVAFDFQTTTTTPNTAALFVEWKCSGSAQGILFVDAMTLEIH